MAAEGFLQVHVQVVVKEKADGGGALFVQSHPYIALCERSSRVCDGIAFFVEVAMKPTAPRAFPSALPSVVALTCVHDAV